MQDILEQEHLQKYVKDSTHRRETTVDHTPAQTQAFQVRNAPWQGAQADFPALGGASGRPAAAAWVRK